MQEACSFKIWQSYNSWVHWRCMDTLFSKSSWSLIDCSTLTLSKCICGNLDLSLWLQQDFLLGLLMVLNNECLHIFLWNWILAYQNSVCTTQKHHALNIYAYSNMQIWQASCPAHHHSSSQSFRFLLTGQFAYRLCWVETSCPKSLLLWIQIQKASLVDLLCDQMGHSFTNNRVQIWR